MQILQEHDLEDIERAIDDHYPTGYQACDRRQKLIAVSMRIHEIVEMAYARARRAEIATVGTVRDDH